MAKTYLTNINLKGNQLLNAAIQPSASAPSALTAGQLYYNTSDGIFYFSTAAGTGNWEPVGVQYVSSVGPHLSVTGGQLNVDFTGLATKTYVDSQGFITSSGQYIQSVGTNLSVNGTELDISGTPEFTSISLTGNGSGNNITIGDDAYIGDVNVSNHIGIKGIEDSTKGGIVFGSAKTESISSNGTDLTLEANNDIILLPGSDYAYIGTPLLDGSNRIAKLSDITGDLTGYVTETGTETLTNKTIQGPLYFNDNVTVSNEGEIVVNSDNNNFEITALTNSLILGSNNGNIILSADGDIYKGSVASNNRIATIGDVSTAQTNAENYANGLAVNYDPAGSATTAENNAKSYTDTKVADLVGMAPDLLNTLEKIDAAIANDANFSTTLLNDITSAVTTAETYADTAATNALNSAKSYTDTQLSSFGNQTSTDITNAITTAENYADNLVTSLALTSKYVETISGNGIADTFTITHNLGKRSVMVQVYQSSGSPDTQWADVEVDMTRVSTNAITIGMGVPPATGTTYEVLIVG